MTRCTLASLALFGLPWTVGCTTTTIREGIWELSLDLEDAMTHERWDFLPRHLVRVFVEKNETGDGEVAEISFLPQDDARPPEAPKLAPLLPNLYADIRPRSRGEPPSFQILGSDKQWEFSLRGVVRSPEYVEGSHAGARLKGTRQNVVLEGVWALRWLRAR